jgi:cysteine-rich repeat protein
LVYLTPRCIKSTCGDRIVEADEECDDGNPYDDDDCLQNCKLNTCGDGQINPRTEACDDDNGANGDGCDSNCTVAACGNGVVTTGEMCDDGNGNDNDSCNNDCTISLNEYIKASNTGAYDSFHNVVLSADGSTLVVGAYAEASAATGIDGNQADDSTPYAGAVYVFTRSGMTWSQQAYLKASNTGEADCFGKSVALSADGWTLAVGAAEEASAATGIGDNQADDSARSAGAVYVFTRSGTMWIQQAYIKSSNTGAADRFGTSVALSANGSTLAVGASDEASAATGIDGNQADNSAVAAGAVYVFMPSGTTWSQQAYVKAYNTTGALDWFGNSVALSADGSTLVVGAYGEDCAAIGIDGNQADDSAYSAGAVYVFTRSGTSWSQQAYVKASNTGVGDQFGSSVALSADGLTLAVGATGEASAATGIGGNQTSNAAQSAGAVYMFTRSGTTWNQQAYVKASDTRAGDQLGSSIALSADGSILAVGALGEDSAATGIGGNQASTSAEDAGAVYVFTRSGTTWRQQAYVKAFNTGAGDGFGDSIALSADSSTLAVGAIGEASAATGIFGDQLDNSAQVAGAVYVFSSWLP